MCEVKFGKVWLLFGYFSVLKFKVANRGLGLELKI